MTNYYIKAVSSSAWQRNPQWPTIPNINNSAYIVWAVFADAPVNGIELTVNAGMSVNWGDGTSSTGSGTLNKTYSYSGITASELISYDGRTYKPVLISIQVTSGNPTDFYIQNTTNTWANNALQVVDRLTNSTGRKRYRLSPTELTLAVTQLNNRSAIYLESISLNHQLTQSAAALSGMRNCQVFDVPINFFSLIFSADSLVHIFNRSFKPRCVVFGNTFFGGASGNISSLFQRAGIWKIGNITMSVSNLITSLFQESQIEEIGNVNFTNVTSCANAFQNTGNLSKLGTITIPTAVTNISNMFNGSSVPEIVFVNSLENVTNVNNAFANNGNIRRLVATGLRLGFDVSRNRLQATALTEMLQSLGNPSTVQNVVISGNPGSVGFVPPTINANWNIIN